MSREEAMAKIAVFKHRRSQQNAILQQALQVTPVVEETLAKVVGGLGSDPLSGEPLARYQRAMPDYESRWGATISPFIGAGLQIMLNKDGVFILSGRFGTKRLISVEPNTDGQIVLRIPGSSANSFREVSLQDFVLDYIADQLVQALSNE